MSELTDALAALPVIAIVRDHGGTLDLVATVTALAEAGIGAVEITADTPGWLDAVEQLQSQLTISLGAGTITTITQVEQLAAAGGRFIVSPHCDPALIERGRALGLSTLPGVFTATEVRTAVAAGADYVKLFPAGPAGVSYLRALLGPFSEVPFVPTGGISIADVAPWLAAGAVAVGLGSDLVRGTPDEVAERAQALVRSLAGVKETGFRAG